MEPSEAARQLQALRVNRRGGPRLGSQVCRQCHLNRLTTNNQSGVCRDCQRKPKTTTSCVSTD